MWCFAQTLARVLFPGTSHRHNYPASESSQSGSSHAFSPAVEPLHPCSFQGLSALITTHCRPSTPLAQSKCVALCNPPFEEGDGEVSSGRCTPCSQELFESPLTITTFGTGKDDPAADNAGMMLEIVRLCLPYVLVLCIHGSALPGRSVCYRALLTFVSEATLFALLALLFILKLLYHIMVCQCIA